MNFLILLPYPKNPKNWCLVCGKCCAQSRSNLCRQHYWEQREHKDFAGSKTLAKLKAKFLRHQYQKVRNHAKKVVSRLGWERECVICGYTKHVELCHIKPIYTFPITATLNEVNVISNLEFRCPNHHWELDHPVQTGC